MILFSTLGRENKLRALYIVYGIITISLTGVFYALYYLINNNYNFSRYLALSILLWDIRFPSLNNEWVFALIPLIVSTILCTIAYQIYFIYINEKEKINGKSIESLDYKKLLLALGGVFLYQVSSFIIFELNFVCSFALDANQLNKFLGYFFIITLLSISMLLEIYYFRVICEDLKIEKKKQDEIDKNYNLKYLAKCIILFFLAMASLVLCGVIQQYNILTDFGKSFEIGGQAINYFNNHDNSLAFILVGIAISSVVFGILCYADDKIDSYCTNDEYNKIDSYCTNDEYNKKEIHKQTADSSFSLKNCAKTMLILICYVVPTNILTNISNVLKNLKSDNYRAYFVCGTLIALCNVIMVVTTIAAFIHEGEPSNNISSYDSNQTLKQVSV